MYIETAGIKLGDLTRNLLDGDMKIPLSTLEHYVEVHGIDFPEMHGTYGMKEDKKQSHSAQICIED